ncbi:MAG: hypothetical protein U0Y82_01360 [Thermoleophilia bacterium]
MPPVATLLSITTSGDPATENEETPMSHLRAFLTSARNVLRLDLPHLEVERDEHGPTIPFF